MKRRTVRSTLDSLLLISVAVAVATGIFVQQLDLHEFRPHAWAGYAMGVFALIHAIHYRSLAKKYQRKAREASVKASPTASPPTESDKEPDSPSEPGMSRRTALISLSAAAGGFAVGWAGRSATSPPPYEGGDVGVFYHQQSGIGATDLIDSIVNNGTRPPDYKTYDASPVELPEVLAPPEMSLADALAQRRSLRSYADRPLTSDELAWLVRSATGITRSGGELRTAPSAGALYPIETYVAIDRVESIDAGIYHVDVRAQALSPVRAGSRSGDIALAGLGQGFLGRAPAVFILTGLFQRSRWKYHERHYRYVTWEAGHIAQNVCLSAESLGLGACVVGAFFDGMLNDLLRIDGEEEAALGFVAVGPRSN